MNITVLGKSTYDKMQLMLTISKSIVACKNKKVMIVTDNSYFKRDYNPWEYEENLIIFNFKTEKEMEQASYSNSEYIIYDIAHIEPTEVFSKILQGSKTFLFTSQQREIIEYNKSLLSILNSDKISFKLIAYKLNELSKIKGKVLAEIYETNSENILSYYENIKDTSIMIDNGHNQVIKIKGMSKEYKQFLTDIVVNLIEVDKKDIKKIKEIHKVIGRIK